MCNTCNPPGSPVVSIVKLSFIVLPGVTANAVPFPTPGSVSKKYSASVIVYGVGLTYPVLVCK